MRPIILVIFFSIGFFSCSKPNRQLVSEIQLFSKEVALDYELNNPTEIELLDSIILLNDPADGYLVTMIDLKNKNKKTLFGAKGRGPNELIPPIGLSSRSDNFYVYSRPMRSLLKFTKADSIPEVISSKFEMPLDKVVIVNDSTVIGIGPILNGRYSVFCNGEETIINHKYPDNPSKPIPQDLQYFAFQANMESGPDNKFVSAAIFTNHFEILEFDDLQIEIIFELDNSIIKWEDLSNSGFKRLSFLDDQRSGYINLSASSKYIYMIYSGRLKGEFGNKALMGNEIHVYNWEGEFKSKLLLDSDIFDLVVSEDDSELFALSRTGQVAILNYKLDGVF